MQPSLAEHAVRHSQLTFGKTNCGEVDFSSGRDSGGLGCGGGQSGPSRDQSAA